MYLFFLVQIVFPWGNSTENTNMQQSTSKNNSDPMFIMSIDGVHCRISEPRKYPSKHWYSFKFSKPGLSYEVGIHIYESKILWINGPFQASKSDVEIFKSALKEKIPDGKKVIADKGYNGVPEKISTVNDLDDKAVKIFKGRVRSRHETLFKNAKDYKILDQRFRSDHNKHKIVFEAVLVILQYDFENGYPLFTA